ncbi:MAG: biotin--[acetyl-CoA-carboxylase] ligase [Pseudomonadota bacterium]
MVNQFLVYDRIDSTNAEAQRQLAQGREPPFVVIAREQDAGRGRRGRSWASPRGNYFATHVVAVDAGSPPIQQVSLVTGLSVHRTIVDLGVDPARVEIKWPNDVLIDEKKVAGILLETQSGTDDQKTLCIGIGINLVAKPTGALRREPITLKDLVAPSVNLNVEGIAQQLSDTLHREITQWREEGFSALKPSLIERLHGIGRPFLLEVEKGRTERAVLTDIDDAGQALFCDSDGKRITHIAGDIQEIP